MTEIVRAETMTELEQLGKALAGSKYFQDASTVSQAIVKVLAGREMGFGPVAAMTGIHIIKGRPTVGANLMAAAVKAHPRYNYRVKTMTDDLVTIAFFEDGQPCGESTFTAQDAAKAGTQNMNRFPRNMLFARAMSNGVRWFCPDVFMGNAVYTPDELGATIDEGGSMIDIPAVIIEKPELQPHTEPTPPTPPMDEAQLGDWMDGQTGNTPAAEVPVDLPQKWPQFCAKVKAELGYKDIPHILNTLKHEIGNDDYSPFYTSGQQAGQMADAAHAWAILASHKLRTDEDGIQF